MNENYTPNTLLKADNLIEQWEKYCSKSMIESVIRDFKNCGFNIDKVDGDLSCWDVSEYITITNQIDIITKAKIILSFVLSGNHILMSEKKCTDSFTTLMAMKESGCFSADITTELGSLCIDINNRKNKKII